MVIAYGANKPTDVRQLLADMPPLPDIPVCVGGRGRGCCRGVRCVRVKVCGGANAHTQTHAPNTHTHRCPTSRPSGCTASRPARPTA